LLLLLLLLLVLVLLLLLLLWLQMRERLHSSPLVTPTHHPQKQQRPPNQLLIGLTCPFVRKGTGRYSARSVGHLDRTAVVHLQVVS